MIEHGFDVIKTQRAPSAPEAPSRPGRMVMSHLIPPHAPGMRIGLFGGSFNPPHEGHALVSKTALRRLKLDRVWWLVTPGNPLKDTSELPSQQARMKACTALVGDDPRIVITGLEAAIGTRYTAQTIAFLRRRCPNVHFVWLMGADNLKGFHRWKDWRKIAASVPIVVIDRPGNAFRAASSRAARAMAGARLDEEAAGTLATTPAPAWLYLHGPRSGASSTALRAQRQGFAAPASVI